MMDATELTRAFSGTPLEPWSQVLGQRTRTVLERRPHGDRGCWMDAVRALPRIDADRVALDADTVCADAAPPIGRQMRTRIAELLERLHPWRKGPFRVHGVSIDSEWRCDWKWRRLAPHVKPLDGKTVLDVGSGNGYYCWRMAGAGALCVLGIDPAQLYGLQFLAMRHFLGAEYAVSVLPLTLEQLPPDMRVFDTVFSMGVLYHRRSPIDHLLALKAAARPGGQLLLETLVVPGPEGRVLVPPGRYARMRNVWFIPSPATLSRWMERCGWRDVHLVDLTATTVADQRSTAWMRFESLAEALDADDQRLTVEGHPAPLRAMFVATAA